MKPEETKWIETCKANPKKYRIDVDNDVVFVVDLEKDEDVFTFDNFGWRMLVDLFRYIGCNAEEV